MEEIFIYICVDCLNEFRTTYPFETKCNNCISPLEKLFDNTTDDPVRVNKTSAGPQT